MKTSTILAAGSGVLILGLVIALPRWQATSDSHPSTHWLVVPYSSQAPDGVWVEPWENACEEIVLAMLDGYYRHDERAQIPPVEAKATILKIIDWEKKNLGYAKDTGAADTKKIVDALFDWKAKIVQHPSLEAIKNELRQNRPVILLVHGSSLNNPHFQDNGPDYHMLLAIGYDDTTQEFITHEPGINDGQGFRYPYSTVMNALHDLVPNQKTSTGQPVVLFTHS